MSQIDGRFAICSKYYAPDDPVVVGLCGSLTKEALTDEAVAKIKLFYNRVCFEHLYVEKFPEGFEPSYPAARTNFPNGYLILKL